MVKNSIAWAKANNLFRKNPVHGKEEYRVPTLETFESGKLEEFSHTVSGDVELQDCQWPK